MSELVLQLLAALEAGTVTKFADLPPEQIGRLTAEFSTGPFSEEQRRIMSGLVLVAADGAAGISAFNASSPIHKINPASLADGTPVLPVSLLTWAGRGQGFAGAWEMLLSMPVRQVTPADWPAPGGGIMTEELRAAAQAGDRFANIILLLYKLGGWGVLSLALLVALRYVWDERASTNQALISELRDGKAATLAIVSQNSEAMQKTAEAQQQVARAVEQLTAEVRRR